MYLNFEQLTKHYFLLLMLLRPKTHKCTLSEMMFALRLTLARYNPGNDLAWLEVSVQPYS